MCFCEPGRLTLALLGNLGCLAKILATIINLNYPVLSGNKWCLSGPVAALFWSLLREGDKALGSDRAVLAKANPPDLMELFE